MTLEDLVVGSLHVMSSTIEVSPLVWLQVVHHFPIHTGLKQVWEVRFLNGCLRLDDYEDCF